MLINLNLADWEWDMVDAEAAACGQTRQELLREMIVDGAMRVLSGEFDLDGMPTPLQAVDRQWKSH